MSAYIFRGDKVKALKDKRQNQSEDFTEITGDTDDPTSVAKDAPIGSFYYRSGTSETYRKLDAGSTTNWELIDFVGAAGKVRAHYNNSSSTMSIDGTLSQRFNPTNSVVDTHSAVTTGATTWVFTAPRTGIYTITVQWIFDSSGSAAGPLSRSSNSEVDSLWMIGGVGANSDYIGGTISAYLASGDTFWIETGSPSSTTDLAGSVNSNYIIITEN